MYNNGDAKSLQFICLEQKQQQNITQMYASGLTAVNAFRKRREQGMQFDIHITFETLSRN